LVLEKVLKVEHHIGDHVVQGMIQTLLHRPTGQATNHAGGFGHLTFQQEHDVVREQVLRGLCGMVHHALNHVQGTLDRTVEQGHRIALFTGLLKPFEDRSKRTHRRAVIEQGLGQRLLGQTGTKHTGFIDVPQGGFVCFGQGFGLIRQVRHFCLALPTLDPKVTEFTEDAPALLQQFTQLTFQVTATNLVLASPLEFIVGPPAGGPGFGFHGRQIGLGRTDRVLRNRKVAHRSSLAFVRGTRLVLKHAQMPLIGLQTASNLGQPLGIGLQICTQRGFFFGHALDAGGQFSA
jgi:hypothetical protein